MGNGESTSRRISMQRSDEGTIQVNFYLQLFIIPLAEELSEQGQHSGIIVKVEPG